MDQQPNALKIRRPVMRFHGGKFRLAPWIMEFFPPHKIYVEPYAGAASVLLRKPRSFAEVYNDLDQDVVNVFQVLRDPPRAMRLAELCRLTPWSRDEFVLSYEPSDDPVERARRTIARGYMAYGTTSRRLGRTGFRAKAYRRNQTGAQDWTAWPAQVEAFIERLRGVTIENRPALEVIEQQDSPETLFYCFLPGSKVRTTDEHVVPIQSLKPGDRIAPGRTVSRMMQRSYNGEALRLKIQGLPDQMEVTANHPVLRIPARTAKRQDKRSDAGLWKRKWIVPASSLKVGDYLLIPTGGEQHEVIWRWLDIAKKQGVRKSGLLFTAGIDLYRLIGYYAAEGHLQKQNGRCVGALLSFGTHEKNTWVADAARCVASSFAHKAAVGFGPHKSVTQVRVWSTTIAEFFYHYVPGLATTKALHPDLMCAPISLQKEILIGWLRGDGGLHVGSRNRVKLCGTSASETLARQMFQIAIRCGLRPSFKRRANNFDVYFASEDTAALDWETTGRCCSSRRIINGHILVRLKSIESFHYSGLVYDIDVDGDDLFAAPFVLAHNCDPPYPQETRSSIRCAGDTERAYAHDMLAGDHRALAEVLHAAQGMVVLSGYACELYDLELYPDWQRHEREAMADAGVWRTEVVWLNQAAVEALKHGRAQAEFFDG